ncbi:MAG: hypothetical protein H6815_10445 [Phycisphaeraceae bacterium]|nr:hypothetical protein [Phycisphaerales bacterium]MCB9860857.1 hypothetical protein [Phycisphaeraceae bacterium]
MQSVERTSTLRALADRLDALQSDHRSGTPRLEPVSTDWAPIARQTSHEWFAAVPPLVLLADIVSRSDDTSAGAVYWIGRACWAYPSALQTVSEHSASLLNRSVFVDVPKRDREARVWTIDVALRNPATVAVIADARGIDTSQSRRLQLAAEASQGVSLLWRSDDELGSLSVSHYRWQVQPERTKAPHPRWRIDCLRCKDAAVLNQGWHTRTFIVEQRDGQGALAVAADVVDRSRQTRQAHTA